MLTILIVGASFIGVACLVGGVATLVLRARTTEHPLEQSGFLISHQAAFLKASPTRPSAVTPVTNVGTSSPAP